VILECKTWARTILRRTKLTGIAHRVRMLWHTGDYEDKFAEVLLSTIQPDDYVWDVGANVGYYTQRFSRVAQHVVAFEPVAENCRQIQSKKMTNVDCLQLALGDTSGDLPMFVDHQFSSVAVAPYPGAPQQTVKVARGDDLLTLAPPTVVKVDVEGYELEVIRGMQRILGGVRALFVEVHFQVLSQRGMQQAPAALVKDLKQMGFSRIEWPDASHIAAFRS
jgi:FkbM family methyltransferase